ncbi:sensor domain-containing diguanylate cyclase [Photobacterium leiognathi]|uniref:sensor domain-containing diguanylate cyclase n=1 Tax=Photobacterium leiognathi TaxID=553611 RepID=UPI002739B457|nr:sensor domain-containing diguanylate cyclase [Photobacterium leiognathi]
MVNKTKITHSSFIILLSLALLIIVIELFFFNNQKEQDILNNKKNIAVNQKVTAVINDKINQMEVSLEVLSYGLSLKADKTAFESLAKRLIADNNMISELQYAPKGIITNVYPFDPKSSAIGHDLNHIRERKKGVERTIESKEVTLIGPVRLIQNDKQAFVFRKPLFDTNDQFQGFVIAISYLDKLRQQLPLKNFNYKIIGCDPDGENNVIFDNLSSAKNKIINAFKVQVPNGKWLFIVQSKHTHYLEQNVYLKVAMYAFVLLICFYVYHREKQFRKQHNSIVAMNNQLHKASYTDELTRLPNRRFLNLQLEAIPQLTTECSYSIAIFDIDNFKHVNDSYGHDIGDEVLIGFANVCIDNLRSNDIIARWGGEEFILLMKNTDIQQAKEVCQRILDALSAQPIIAGKHKLLVTTSAGLGTFSSVNFDSISALKSIDEALYQAKNTGKNKVVTA